MKSNFSTFVVLLLSTFMLASCLKNNTDEITYYEDTAITSFSVGTLKRYVHTTTNGIDSVHLTKINCSTYKFNIDQNSREIFNPDSLPLGVDGSKVLVNLTTLNSGVVLINLKTKDGLKDSLVRYSSTDSIDFTKPLEFRVYNNAGNAYRSYQVKINIHQENGTLFKWTQVAENDQLVASMKGMRSLFSFGKLWLMGSDGTGSRLYVSEPKQPLSWKLVTEDVYAADAYKNFVLCMGTPMFISNGTMYQFTSNGDEYDCHTKEISTISTLLGGNEDNLYGYNSNGKLVRYDALTDFWNEELIDDKEEWLPTEDVNIISIPSKVNSLVNKLVMVGNRSKNTYPTDVDAVVWSKVEENEENSLYLPWAFYSKNPAIKYNLPRFSNLQVVRYGTNMLAVGGNVVNGTAKDISKFYKSEDEGITWQTDTIYQFPKGFSSNSSVFTMTCDADNYIWVLAGESGQVWKGRLNEMGWRKEQGAFEK